MHNSDSKISFVFTISNLAGVFKSLSFTRNLEGLALLNQALDELPPNKNESWALHTVKRSLYAHAQLRADTRKNRNQKNQANAGSSVTAAKILSPIQKCLTKSPINSIRHVLFAKPNMAFGPVASTRENSYSKSKVCCRADVEFFLYKFGPYFLKMPKI